MVQGVACLIVFFFNYFNLSVFTGGGVEPESHYPQWKRVYQNIERYPALNDSIAKLTEGTFNVLTFFPLMTIVHCGTVV